jgi:hypothetical protein
VTPAFAGVWFRLEPNQLVDALAAAGAAAATLRAAKTAGTIRERRERKLVSGDIDAPRV